MVARSVKPAELKWNTDAQHRRQEEIDKLELREVGDLEGVRQWADVSADAKRRNEKAHLGHVLGICVEKGSELPKNHPDRKFKGRYAY